MIYVRKLLSMADMELRDDMYIGTTDIQFLKKAADLLASTPKQYVNSHYIIIVSLVNIIVHYTFTFNKHLKTC